MGAGEEALIEAEADKPANLVLHKNRPEPDTGQCAAARDLAKREAGEPEAVFPVHAEETNKTMKTLLKISRALALSGLIMAAALQSGCLLVAAGAVAGAGAVVYVRGELDASLDDGHASVDVAANRAIDQLKFRKISESKDSLKAVLIARTADDTKVEIKVLKVSEVLTKVEIRVGTFGDQALSMTILEKIKAGL